MLKPKGSLPGKASENWCLFRLLPCVIGHLIPSDNELWKIYLTLRHVCDIVTAPVVHQTWLQYLKSDTEEFLSLFIQVFPENVTPKMHFLIHYSRLIEVYVPLEVYGACVFEAKHNYFKRVANVVHNFKNICLTLATRHQMRQTWEMNAEDFLSQGFEHSAKCVPISFSKLSKSLQSELVKRLHNENTTDHLVKVHQLTADHVRYPEGNFVIVGLLHSE